MILIYEPCMGMKLCGESNTTWCHLQYSGKGWREKDRGEWVTDEGRQKVDYLSYTNISICLWLFYLIIYIDSCGKSSKLMIWNIDKVNSLINVILRHLFK